jgi:hypothetical protein
MEWIQSLELEKWIINVFSGNPEIFGAIAILVISGLAGYFRMNTLSMFFMLSIFLLMFSGYIGSSFVAIFAIIGGLLVGYFISRFFQ